MVQLFAGCSLIVAIAVISWSVIHDVPSHVHLLIAPIAAIATAAFLAFIAPWALFQVDAVDSGKYHSRFITVVFLTLSSHNKFPASFLLGHIILYVISAGNLAYACTLTYKIIDIIDIIDNDMQTITPTSK